MKTATFQYKTDLVIRRLFLWAIPPSVTPNVLSYLRLGLIPPIIILLWSGNIWWALFMFAFAALTDALDGAMARTRNQITDLGKILDPIADKALIGTMLVYFGFDYLIIKIFLVFILLEIVSILTSSLLSYKFGKPIGANFFGKVKMLLQTISVFVFILGIILTSSLLITLAEYTLFVALVFAVLAGIEVFRKKWPKIIEVLKF
jgi:CDP-diacylglycerol---glycerol-3-phosphate 3-phosphatidyltransferase